VIEVVAAMACGGTGVSRTQRECTFFHHRFRERIESAAAYPIGHGAKKSGIAIMPTSREYRHRAEECLKLANETAEIYARMALLELAGEFSAMAQQIDLRARGHTPDQC
jgi:hypothetical protein